MYNDSRLEHLLETWSGFIDLDCRTSSSAGASPSHRLSIHFSPDSYHPSLHLQASSVHPTSFVNSRCKWNRKGEVRFFRLRTRRLSRGYHSFLPSSSGSYPEDPRRRREGYKGLGKESERGRASREETGCPGLARQDGENPRARKKEHWNTTI